MPGRDEVLEDIRKVVLKVTRAGDIALGPESTARDVPGWDSLAHVSIVAGVEQLYGVRFSLKELKNLKTVGNLVDLVCAKTG